MVKRLYPIVFLLLALNTVFAQHTYNIDSLRRIIDEQKGDTNEVLAMAYYASQQKNINSGIAYAQRALLIAKETNDPKVEADCLLLGNDKLATRGYFNQSISYLLKANQYQLTVLLTIHIS